MHSANKCIFGVAKAMWIAWFHSPRSLIVPCSACGANIGNPCWLFPSAAGSMQRVAQATKPMDRGGVQSAMKVVVAECGIKKSLDSYASTQLRHPSA